MGEPEEMKRLYEEREDKKGNGGKEGILWKREGERSSEKEEKGEQEKWK